MRGGKSWIFAKILQNAVCFCRTPEKAIQTFHRRVDREQETSNGSDLPGSGGEHHPTAVAAKA